MGSIKLGPWGGDDGSAWHYNPSECAITGIVINYEDTIHSISFKSIDIKSNTEEFSKTFGGDGGKSEEISFNWPGEYLTNISGTINKYDVHQVIESLCFHTNRTKYGPYGKMNGSTFTIPMEGAEIVGFFGRKGDRVDAIGIYAKPSTT
ncbi:hypothetical protein ACOSP7_031325 [Xanthoceras sorbifolium]